jgi:hypothetical protein
MAAGITGAMADSKELVPDSPIAFESESNDDPQATATIVNTSARTVIRDVIFMCRIIV